METGKTSKYLKYAIGEITLVVIGILIALQINNWNENRKQEERAVVYVNKIINDLETDLKNIDSITAIGQRNLKAIDGYFNYFENQNPVNIQNLVDSCTQTLENDLYKYRYTPNNHTFKDMQSSGNSTLLSEDQKSALIKLSNTQDYFLIVLDKVIASNIESERKAKSYIDTDLSSSNFFEKIGRKQSANNLTQGLLHQHNALTSYSRLLFHTTRLKKRILKETDISIKALKTTQ